MGFDRGRARTWVTIFLAVLAMVACRSYQGIALDAIRTDVEFGDQVRVLEKDGSRHAFEVTYIDDEVIEGWGVRVPLDEIASIEAKKIRFWRSLLAGLGIGYLAVIVVGSITAFVLWFALS